MEVLIDPRDVLIEVLLQRRAVGDRSARRSAEEIGSSLAMATATGSSWPMAMLLLRKIGNVRERIGDRHGLAAEWICRHRLSNSW